LHFYGETPDSALTIPPQCLPIATRFYPTRPYFSAPKPKSCKIAFFHVGDIYGDRALEDSGPEDLPLSKCISDPIQMKLSSRGFKPEVTFALNHRP